MAYRISNKISGAIIGIFPGRTPEEAHLAMVVDAGYVSAADAAETLGQTEEEFFTELNFEEAEEEAESDD